MPRTFEPTEPRRSKREMIIKRDCKLCKDQISLDYKQPDLLKKFMTERGKIVSRRLSGLTAKQQRAMSMAIKWARYLAILPVGAKRRYQ